VGLLGKGGFMSIEDDVKAAIEKFGELAYERFEVETAPKFWINSTNNSQLITAFARLKTLPELFAHDVKVYGDNAHLMWKIFDNYINKPKEWLTPLSNKELDYYLSYHLEDEIIKRKTSAARPFDLERAKAGDVVEWERDKHDWIKAKLVISTDIRIQIFVNGDIVDSGHINKSRLRMKFPKKVRS